MWRVASSFWEVYKEVAAWWPLQNSSYAGIALAYCVNVTVSGPANFSYIQDQMPHMESKIIGIYESSLPVSYLVQASNAQHFQAVAVRDAKFPLEVGQASPQGSMSPCH